MSQRNSTEISTRIVKHIGGKFHTWISAKVTSSILVPKISLKVVTSMRSFPRNCKCIVHLQNGSLTLIPTRLDHFHVLSNPRIRSIYWSSAERTVGLLSLGTMGWAAKRHVHNETGLISQAVKGLTGESWTTVCTCSWNSWLCRVTWLLQPEHRDCDCELVP